MEREGRREREGRGTVGRGTQQRAILIHYSHMTPYNTTLL
jgi:hypothetical protein